MRATVYHGPRDIRVEEVPDATVREPTDALVRVTHACICGSDLWPYRGELEIYGRPGPHRARVHRRRRGGRLRGAHAAPGPAGDRALRLLGRHLRLLPRGPADLVPGRGLLGQAATTAARARPCARRSPTAPWSRCPRTPTSPTTGSRAPLATLTDVMGTGHHGALALGRGAGRRPSSWSATARSGSAPCWPPGGSAPSAMIVLGHHADRLEIARGFGATDVVDRARRRGRRAGPRADRRRRPSRRRVRRDGRLVRHGHRQSPAPGARSATSACRPIRSTSSTSTCATSA